MCQESDDSRKVQNRACGVPHGSATFPRWGSQRPYGRSIPEHPSASVSFRPASGLWRSALKSFSFPEGLPNLAYTHSLRFSLHSGESRIFHRDFYSFTCPCSLRTLVKAPISKPNPGCRCNLHRRNPTAYIHNCDISCLSRGHRHVHWQPHRAQSHNLCVGLIRSEHAPESSVRHVTERSY